MTRRYPFSAVAGQAQAKRALLLACLNSAVGGVLLGLLMKLTQKEKAHA